MIGLEQRRRIWIVDDSPLDAERARHVLASDYEVDVFCDGSAALEALSSRDMPHLMVLDWVMPGISGVDVCRFLRSGAAAHAEIAVLLLTSNRHTEEIVEGLSAGANDYLPKPYADTELRARVQSQIRAIELLERAARAEELNRQLLESSPDPLIAINAEGQLTFANGEARRVFSAPSSLLGKSIAEVIPGFPALDWQWVDESSFRTLPDVEVGGRLFSPTVRLPPASGLESATLSLRDVTSRRQTEARRLDFYSIIAHDLRSPLNAITLRTYLILNGKHGQLPDGLTQDIHKIEASSRSLVVMINDFLEMARVDGTHVKVDLAAVDVTELLDAAMEGVRPLLESGALTWQSSTPPPLADRRVKADSKRLAQVFTNLLGNAIKFTPADGVIKTTVQRAGAWVEISVEDTGPGIPAEALPTLFDRYTQAGNTQSKVASSGLGLMIVRDIVEAHGGSVGVESQLAVGSRFWVRLPSENAASSRSS